MYCGIAGSTQKALATPIKGNPIMAINHLFGNMPSGANTKSPTQEKRSPIVSTIFLSINWQSFGTKLIQMMYEIVNQPNKRLAISSYIPYYSI
jgi:hypothetical protein